MLTAMITEAPQVVLSFDRFNNRQIYSVAGGELKFEAQPFRETGFGSTTYGALGHRKVEAELPQESNFDLEARLSMLCDKLRAKY